MPGRIRWATPSWGDWKRIPAARNVGWTYVRSACTFEVRFTPKARKPKPGERVDKPIGLGVAAIRRADGTYVPIPVLYPGAFFPSADLVRIHHNGCEDLLVRLWTYACPPTKEEAFDVLTELGRRLGVWA